MQHIYTINGIIIDLVVIVYLIKDFIDHQKRP